MVRKFDIALQFLLPAAIIAALLIVVEYIRIYSKIITKKNFRDAVVCQQHF
jgi:hypothetical protein